MLKVADYLKFAEECRRLAQTAESEHQRAMLLAMARTWTELAKERRRLLERAARRDRKRDPEPTD